VSVAFNIPTSSTASRAASLLVARGQAIDDLSGVPGLTSLWLGRNKITKLTGLDVVPGLAQLGLQSNRLTSLVPGLAPVVGLRELYVSHNGLTSLEGIGHLVRWWAGVCCWRWVLIPTSVRGLPIRHCRYIAVVRARLWWTRATDMALLALVVCALFFFLFSLVSFD